MGIRKLASVKPNATKRNPPVKANATSRNRPVKIGGRNKSVKIRRKR